VCCWSPQKLWQKALSLLAEDQPERGTLQRMLNELAQIQNKDAQPSILHAFTSSGFSSTRCFILAILCAKVGTFSLWTSTTTSSNAQYYII
jgi:hypothetical protein